jgi:hypothetical protein
MNVRIVADAAELLRMEYAEMPGLALTAWQAQRLCNLSSDVCDTALRTLLDAGFLRTSTDGVYRRAASSPTVRTLWRVMREAP